MVSKNNQPLRIEIINVFPKVNPPNSNNLTLDNYGDSPQLHAYLDGVRWWLAGAEAIDKTFDKLALLTPDAFHYYLPAFLLWSIDHFERTNQTLEFTIYSLSPTKTPRNAPWFSERRKRFTPEQIATVRKFLQAILDEPSMYSFYNDAKRGIIKFWD